MPIGGNIMTRAKYMRRWIASNREHLQKYKRQYRIRNRSHILAYRKQYRIKNISRIKAQQKAWLRVNPRTPEQIKRYKKDSRGKTKRKYLKTERNRKYLRRYGLTTIQYNEMLSLQNNVCFLCRRSNPNGRALAVDHDHTTKRVRKLLCDRCNKGLGHFEDNLPLMKKAVQYLKNHQK